VLIDGAPRHSRKGSRPVFHSLLLDETAGAAAQTLFITDDVTMHFAWWLNLASGPPISMIVFRFVVEFISAARACAGDFSMIKSALMMRPMNLRPEPVTPTPSKINSQECFWEDIVDSLKERLHGCDGLACGLRVKTDKHNVFGC